MAQSFLDLLSGAGRPSGGSPLPPFLAMQPPKRAGAKQAPPPEKAETPEPHAGGEDTAEETDDGVGKAESEIFRAIVQRKPLLDADGNELADFSFIPKELAAAIHDLLTQLPAAAEAPPKPKGVGPTTPKNYPPKPQDVRSPLG